MSRPALLHASAAALGARGVLIRGASGAGKSTLLMQLVGLGARLVGDDQLRIWTEEGRLMAAPAPGLEGLLEARGLGLMRLRYLEAAAMVLVVDLDISEASRLPQFCVTQITDVTLPLIAGGGRPNLGYEVTAFLRDGQDPPLLDPETPLA